MEDENTVRCDICEKTNGARPTNCRKSVGRYIPCLGPELDAFQLLQRENAELQRENTELQRENAELQRENAERQRENTELKQRILILQSQCRC